MIAILLLLIAIGFVYLRRKSKIKTREPIPLGSRSIAKERLMKDKLLKEEYRVATSKKRYHRIGCRYADKKGSFSSISMAKDRNLLPCKVCRP